MVDLNDAVMALESFLCETGNHAKELDELIRDAADNSEVVDLVEKGSEILTRACKTLESVEKYLGGTEDGQMGLIQLAEAKFADGIGFRNGLVELEAFIGHEKKLLRRYGLDQDLIDKACERMQSEDDLMNPNNMFDAKSAIFAVKDLKEQVCLASEALDKIHATLRLDLLRSILRGLVDVCVIGADTLSVFTTPISSPLVFLTAAKSVFGGASSLREQVKAIKNIFLDSKKKDTQEKIDKSRNIHAEKKKNMKKKKINKINF